MANSTGSITRSVFFDRVLRVSKSRLPSDLSDLHARRFAHLLKIYQDNERVHFEVWVDGARSSIELGLHFEDGPESTASYLSFFDQRIVEIKDQLGPEIELARWTASWGHLYERHEMYPFDLDRAQMIGQRLADVITVLHPQVVEAGVPPEIRRPPTGEPGRRWRRRRGAR